MTQNKLVGEKAEALPPQLTVTGKLEHIAPIQVEDYLYVQSCLSAPGSVVKVAIPSPTMVRTRAFIVAKDCTASMIFACFPGSLPWWKGGHRHFYVQGSRCLL